MVDISQLNNSSVLVWLTITHTLFLIIPALIWASDDWLHPEGGLRFKGFHRAKHDHYPHYLAH